MLWMGSVELGAQGSWEPQGSRRCSCLRNTHATAAQQVLQATLRDIKLVDCETNRVCGNNTAQVDTLWQEHSSY